MEFLAELTGPLPRLVRGGMDVLLFLSLMISGRRLALPGLRFVSLLRRRDRAWGRGMPASVAAFPLSPHRLQNLEPLFRCWKREKWEIIWLTALRACSPTFVSAQEV